MKKKLFGYLNTNRRGLALITVLGVVTLATILVLALFSVSDAEFKASTSYLDGAKCRTLADSAVQLVISQIQSGATGVGVAGTGVPSIWASQPGAIRVYQANGTFAQGRKLYSSSQMILPGGAPGAELAMASETPSATWDQLPSGWVDLNEPVNVVQSNQQVQTYFPILDPRAATHQNDPDGGGSGLDAIEGFTFDNTVAKTPSVATVGGMVDGDPHLRLPMPVEWLYVLKNGSMGTVVNAGGGKSSRWNPLPGSGSPSEDNPIIGRIAFWTDDESSKINVNTAAEPGAFQVPRVFHDRDKNWVDSPPVVYEYQRWPGHPATVALSSVLAPNATHLVSQYDGDSYPNFSPSYIDLKNKIYDLVPYIARGGSGDGTLVFAFDEQNANITQGRDQLFTNIQAARRERRFVSVDEMLFQSSISGSSGRVASKLEAFGRRLITPTVLERSKFFLTANSKSPETNMFGYPRVAIWPVPDKPLGPRFRTPYDEAIALAATLGDPLTSTNTYFFSRSDAASSIADMGGNSPPAGSGLTRNNDLIKYLDKLTHHVMPGTGNSFYNKYGKDQRQILVEIFDYIRCTNLYDSFLDDQYVKEKGQRDKWDDGGAANRPPSPLPGYRKPASQVDLWTNRPKQFTYYTFTPPRFDAPRRAPDQGGVPTNKEHDYEITPVTSGAYPGHGQVKPIEWTSPDNETYKGFGRLPTISEVALHFICTGDGQHDDGSYQIKKGTETIYSGGKTAQKINTKIPNQRLALKNNVQDPNGMWFSNIPPYPGKKYFEDAGCNFALVNTGLPGDPLKHPAADAKNWNCTLDWNPTDGGVALKDTTDAGFGEKRIQIALELELFVPEAGYTKYTPDFTIVLNGNQLGNLEVQDVAGRWRKMFNTTANAVVQSTSAYMGSLLGQHAGSNAVNPMGGSYGARPLVAGRQCDSVGKMPKDSGYQDGATSTVHGAMLNFPFVSSYFTVQRKKAIKFRAKGGIGIEADIYASHDWQGKEDKKNSTPSQRVMIKFPDGEQTTPEPWLVVFSSEQRLIIDSSGNEYRRRAVNACHWWAFNAGGAVGRYVGVGRAAGANGLDWTGITENPKVPNDDGSGTGTGGRFLQNGEGSSTKTIDPFNTHQGGTGVTVAMNGIIYGYSNLPDYSGTQSTDTDLLKADLYEPKGGAMGKYYFYGTDAVRSLVPSHGDYRVLAAMRQVPATVWKPHRLWNTGALFAHSLSGSTSDSETGYDNGAKDPNAPLNSAAKLADPQATNRLVPNAWYPIHQVPDTPLTQAASDLSNATRDFDNGPADMRDGAYINKPDEGNMSVGQFWWGSGSNTEGDNQFHVTRNAYFMSSYLQIPASNSYFTPNRMIPSAGMFGSLPTGVYGSPTNDPNGVPWRTLLFRPSIPDRNGRAHYGAPAWAGPGAADPADHYFLDLFWMPVIEPYAISDAYSTAGKINLNFQMLPFRHITRSTALHAALKGELITAMSSKDVDPRKAGKPSKDHPVVYKLLKDDNATLGQKIKLPHQFWKDEDGMGWHRAINRDATIQQLKDRFYFNGVPAASGGLMRTASQVCELHLVPMPAPAGSSEPPVESKSFANLASSMTAFWDYNNLTGDNTREGPYTNLYQKFTTRSNTYRVYFRVQTIKKARSTDASEIDETRDTVTGEYRGSALLERYLDMKSKTFVDYATAPDVFATGSLEKKYHYRVLETKQFAP